MARKRRMSEGEASAPPGAASYRYRPSLLGAPCEFRLDAGGLDWSVGRKTGRVAWRDVTRVRLSFRPANLQTHRFATEIWAAGAPKLVIMSTSWKSMVLQERLDRAYVAFVSEIHRHLARAGTRARFDLGTNPIQYWPGLAVFVVILLALATLMVRALRQQAVGGALFIAVFFGLFLWYGGDYFRRNRPRSYDVNALPADLMPRL
jgi:hypothetical protein